MINKTKHIKNLKEINKKLYFLICQIRTLSYEKDNNIQVLNISDTIHNIPILINKLYDDLFINNKISKELVEEIEMQKRDIYFLTSNNHIKDVIVINNLNDLIKCLDKILKINNIN